MRRNRALFLSLIALVVLIAGCTGRSIVIKWDPNPVVMYEGDESIKGKVTIKAAGLLGSIYIDTISAVAYDTDGEEIVKVTEKVDITIPPFTSPQRSFDVTLKASYDDVIKGKGVAKVAISVSGDDPGVLTIEIRDGGQKPTT